MIQDTSHAMPHCINTIKNAFKEDPISLLIVATAATHGV